MIVKLPESFLSNKSRILVYHTIITDSPWPPIHTPRSKTESSTTSTSTTPISLLGAGKDNRTFLSDEVHQFEITFFTFPSWTKSIRPTFRPARRKILWTAPGETLPADLWEKMRDLPSCEIWKILCSVLTQKKAMWFQISDWQTCLTLIAFLTLFIIIKHNHSPRSLSCFASRVCWYFEF